MKIGRLLRKSFPFLGQLQNLPQVWGVEEEGGEAAAESAPTSRPRPELRGGTGASTGNLIQMPEPPEK